MADGPVSSSDKLLSRAVQIAPAIAVLALLLALNSSHGRVSDPPPDPRSVVMLEEGRSALVRSEFNSAIDAFETALALDPGHTDAYVGLADATREQGLAGKAIRYYRQVLERDPANFTAKSGEGKALVAQGAMDQAMRNLASLEAQCGTNCPETKSLQATIAAGPPASFAAESALDGPTSN